VTSAARDEIDISAIRVGQRHHRALMSAMTRAERENLQRLVRQREKVLKSAGKQRSAKLLADFENQMGSEFSFDQDEIWATAQQSAEREVLPRSSRPSPMNSPAMTGRPEPIPRERLRHLARRIHRLGERPLYGLFRELDAAADFRARVERYAALDADFIAEQGGRDVPSPRIVSRSRSPPGSQKPTPPKAITNSRSQQNGRSDSSENNSRQRTARPVRLGVLVPEPRLRRNGRGEEIIENDPDATPELARLRADAPKPRLQA
jgi:hypothetical protein